MKISTNVLKSRGATANFKSVWGRQMRRLAKQNRDDRYGSSRDYQSIFFNASTRISKNNPIKILKFKSALNPGPSSSLAGFGGYISLPSSTPAAINLYLNGQVYSHRRSFGIPWARMGRGFFISGPTNVEVEIEFDTPQDYIDIWDVCIGLSHSPSGTIEGITDLAELNVSHLLPETLYLESKQKLDEIVDTALLKVSSGSVIETKKCSYCQRFLPTGPAEAAGLLAFHKHNAKLTGHQNECRSCKKWRINRALNPLRTIDQLNESSIISRERQLLLQEPAILKKIKEREGRGLKSIIWERFEKRCFFCNKKLKMSEVQLDHTRPLAYLWPIDEHATCLCAEHNNNKKDKFPIDFYSNEQLYRLSAITGLSLNALKKRDICEPQLLRIQKDISGFARQWDARVFNAIARKVKEVRPQTDLFAELKSTDAATHANLLVMLSKRPEELQAEVESFVDELSALED